MALTSHLAFFVAVSRTDLLKPSVQDRTFDSRAKVVKRS